LDWRELSSGTSWILPLHYERLNRRGAISPIVCLPNQPSRSKELTICRCISKGTSTIEGKWSYEILIILQFAFVGGYPSIILVCFLAKQSQRLFSLSIPSIPSRLTTSSRKEDQNKPEKHSTRFTEEAISLCLRPRWQDSQKLFSSAKRSKKQLQRRDLFLCNVSRGQIWYCPQAHFLISQSDKSNRNELSLLRYQQRVSS